MIRGHKKINDGLIETAQDKGVILKTFYCLVERFNKQYEYEPLSISKSELWSLCGLEGEYDQRNIRKLIEILTKSETYNLKNQITISGSMFVTEELKDGTIDIHIPKPFRKYLFYKRDIDLMTKAKRKESMDVKELDYYDKEVKPKSKELVLLSKAHILGLKGKYNIRLYTLLKQWDSIGKYEKNYNEFKEIMEIPKSYRARDINKQVLDKAKTELLKANIEIISIEKTKKGRNIDKIIIKFNNLEKIEDAKEVIKKVEEPKVLTPEEVAIEKTLTKLFLKLNNYTLRDLGDIKINNELKKFVEENK